jgi:hypothetical protein
METEIVRFHEDEIICINKRIVINAVAKAIGLNTESAVRGVKNHKILGAVATLESAQLDGNQARSYLTLPVEYVSGWLFSISLEKVNEDAQPKLELYQRECYQVLYEHFFGKHKVVSDNQRELAMISNRMREIDKMIREGLKERKNIQLQKTAIEMENFRQLGIAFDDSEEIEIFDNNKGFLSKAL